jgi:hypothetical protein
LTPQATASPETDPTKRTFVAHNVSSGHIAPERVEYCHGQRQRLWRTSQLFWEKSFYSELTKKEDTTHPHMHKKQTKHTHHR